MLQHDNVKGAIALGYESEKNAAPTLLAKGIGELAEKILQVGEDNNIYIKEDKMLYDSLYPLAVGDEIPVKLYRAVAEILAFVYKLEDQTKAGKL
jgi:flagellar biosynthesis protein